MPRQPLIVGNPVLVVVDIQSSAGDTTGDINGHHCAETPHSSGLRERASGILGCLHLEIGTDTHQDRDHRPQPPAHVSRCPRPRLEYLLGQGLPYLPSNTKPVVRLRFVVFFGPIILLRQSLIAVMTTSFRVTIVTVSQLLNPIRVPALVFVLWVATVAGWPSRCLAYRTATYG